MSPAHTHAHLLNKLHNNSWPRDLNDTFLFCVNSRVAIFTQKLIHTPFLDYEPTNAQNVWKDVDKIKYQRVSDLKNRITEKIPKRLSYMPAVKSMDPGRWLTSKDASVYERQLTFDVGSKILTNCLLTK